MVQINFALKEVNCKVVYYGPGMSGKTTNLEIVHQKAPEEHKGELTSISTDGDRTLFFDFMPLDLGKIAGMQTKFQLYTVPGQVYYNSTRKLVLQGVDGVIFIADSNPDKMPENLESYENLIENLKEYGKELQDLPHVIQYNKRDSPNAMSVEDLDRAMNRWGVPTFEAVANTGEGVFPTLKTLAGMVLESINKAEKSGPGSSRSTGRSRAPSAAESSVKGAASASGNAGPARSATGQVAVPTKAAVAAQAQPRRPAAARTQPSGVRRAVQPQQRQMAPNPAQRASHPPQEGKGFLVAFLVLLIAAVAGVVYLLLQQNA